MESNLRREKKHLTYKYAKDNLNGRAKCHTNLYNRNGKHIAFDRFNA